MDSPKTNFGDNNGTFSNGDFRPNNQFHVEDPQQFIGDFFARIEVAPSIWDMKLL
jgi:hypothetical protein